MKKLVHLIFMIALVAALIPETARSQDSGAGAAAATDPTVPLSQLQLQNQFIPESFNSTGYSNRCEAQGTRLESIKRGRRSP